MEPAALYGWLTGPAAAPGADAFDCHVAASILAISAAEAPFGELDRAAGIEAAPLATLARHFFPAAADLLHAWAGGSRLAAAPLARDPAEAALYDLLWRSTMPRTPFRHGLAGMIARRVQRANHLWQDLGLNDRSELSLLMQRHFEWLARRNSQDMKWKKFLYRMICRDEGYALCTVPSCDECGDFELCFGEESGEALLARIRRRESGK